MLRIQWEGSQKHQIVGLFDLRLVHFSGSRLRCADRRTQVECLDSCVAAKSGQHFNLQAAEDNPAVWSERGFVSWDSTHSLCKTPFAARHHRPVHLRNLAERTEGRQRVVGKLNYIVDRVVRRRCGFDNLS